MIKVLFIDLLMVMLVAMSIELNENVIGKKCISCSRIFRKEKYVLGILLSQLYVIPLQ